MKRTLLKLLLIGSIVSSVMLNACEKEDESSPDNPDYTQDKGEFKDLRDKHVYKWVKIGDQIWMAENLAFTDSGRHELYNNEWAYSLENDDFLFDGWCVYENDKNFGSMYGVLYQWQVAKAACPEGWHLPTDAEWTILELFIDNDGHSGNVASALKSIKGWDNGGGGTDDYGFTALPGGDRTCSEGEFRGRAVRGAQRVGKAKTAREGIAGRTQRAGGRWK